MAGMGTLIRHSALDSRFVAGRNVDVWLPPGYDTAAGSPLPVVYMHDGQNLFDPELAFACADWGVDEAIVRLLDAGQIDGAIVVGIWNRGDEWRWREYMPQQALPSPASVRRSAHGGGGEPISDDYLRFVVREVKPFVDDAYPTLPGRESTFVMGSSMGALISLYALCEYPEVFGGAGCLSTHWPAGDGVVIDYLREALPSPGDHLLYFDYGTETLDAEYEEYQLQADVVLRAAGYRQGVDWITLKFEGAEHSERSWCERVHIPLRFLLTGGGDEGHLRA